MLDKWRILILCTILVGVSAWAGVKRPWHLRADPDAETFHITAHKKTPPDLWWPEPESPENPDAAVFEKALKKLCGRIPPKRLNNYSNWILGSAGEFEVDPFLLAGLIYDQSRCWPATPKRASRMGRYGLTRIKVAMHAPHLRKGQYNYYIREEGNWSKKSLLVDKFPFNKWKAAKAESNIYFAAAILKVLGNQEKDVDSVSHSHPHRHFVSHWFYGDRILSPEPENRVLTARRMILSYYGGEEPTKAGTYRDVPLVSPLDGVPRLVLDYFGNKRGKKNGYGHRGIDLDGASGEVVRAIAAGRVTFAGVDLPGQSNHQMLDIKESEELKNSEMGPGGLYVSINHGNEFGTIYMHLDSLAVKYQDRVEAGDVIGTLGRSGTERSGPHLHLEFRVGTDRVDPAVPLKGVVVNPHLKPL